MKNYLTLRKCAYIFDSSADRFFYGTSEQYAKKMAIRKELERFYYEPEKRLEKIPYTKDNDKNIIITINGEPHRLNALQIASIEGDPENVINHRQNIDPEKVLNACPSFEKRCTNDIRSKKYKSLYFEFYTGENELGYIRVHFNNNHEQFIINDRTGAIYTSGEYGDHEPTTAAKIAERLNIKSNSAKSAFYEVINAITKIERI